MHEAMIPLVFVIAAALVFDYINGFHDTANAIATVVSTHVLPPRVAILMAAGLNFAGAFYSENVAKTIANGLTDPLQATQTVILSAILGAIVWNLITWRYGIPSSSSHALIGGLVGAALAHSGGKSIFWGGILEKAVLPLIGSPLLGFALAFVLMGAIYRIFAHVHPARVKGLFYRLQVISAAFMAFSHGSNDAQKSMGIITMALVSLGLLKTPQVPLWVMAACATAMGAGTMAGGWRIIRAMGHRIVRLQPVQGFAAETSAASVILLATHFKMPVSTTHTIAGGIFGVGASKRFSAVRWGVAQSMIMAWLLTIPASAAVGGAVYLILSVLGMK
jgi:PiT family inorganic phosphate transporter